MYGVVVVVVVVGVVVGVPDVVAEYEMTRTCAGGIRKRAMVLVEKTFFLVLRLPSAHLGAEACGWGQLSCVGLPLVLLQYPQQCQGPRGGLPCRPPTAARGMRR